MHSELSPLNNAIVRVWRWLEYKVTMVPRHVSLSSEQWYLCGSMAVLLGSTLFWAILGAHVQLHNADQLSDPYMFSNSKTFHGAAFPESHTFLLKWPVFWLVSAVGVSSASLTVATVGVVLATVAALAWLLYKIERRPAMLGTEYLGLALTLLLIPPQPYSGGLLPVNMAMLTTRNLEYIVYILSALYFVKARRIVTVQFGIGVALLALLIASDKLFIGLSFGGSVIALVAYALRKNWRMVGLAARWMVGSAVAATVATCLLAVIAAMHVTHFVNGGGVSPYAIGLGAKNIALGAVYALLGLLTNLGANPIYSNRTLTSLSSELSHTLRSPSGILHVGALLLVSVGLAAVLYVFLPGLRRRVGQRQDPALVDRLAIVLIWSTLAALGVFIATQHYYAVDARYLTIGLFAVVVSSAAAFRTFVAKDVRHLMVAGGVLAVGVVGALAIMHATVQTQTRAYSELSSRNVAIAQLLKQHKVDVLVGDYWRVLPIKLASEDTQRVMPMASCTTPTNALTSKEWQPNLKRHSFAYLATFDGSLTNYPNCGLPQITSAYGRPNAVQVIAGTLVNPKEVLLFYDQGSRPSMVKSSSVSVSNLLPGNAGQLGETTCQQSTIMNVVAHQDDDLLFLNPDLQHELRAGDCVRTIYTTAGDSGHDKFYWLSRQLGAEAAYSEMLHIQNTWDQRTLVVGTDKYVTIATPRDHPDVSLLYLNLPDGDLRGEGFSDSGHQSLAKLQSDQIASIQTVDGQSRYTASQLTSVLMMLMEIYQPAEIHTQANDKSVLYPDHSDHIATSWFTTQAAEKYDQRHVGDVVQAPVLHYRGYPIRDQMQNVFGNDLELKRAAFFVYAHYDGGVCSSVTDCAEVPTYNDYLSRQYVQQ